MRLHPLAADGLIAAALTTVAVLLGTEAVAQGWPALDPLAWTLVALLTLPLVLRTRAPVTVCLAVHACWALYITLDYWPVVGSFGPMLAVYTVAAQRPTRTAAACAALLAGVWIYAGLRSDSGAMASVAGQAVGFPLVLWRFGYVARRTGELTLRLRAEQADRARREVAEERVRIARELHDVVAHHIAVINVQAGLARFVFRSDARTARDALDTIEGASGEALAELRRMLGLLRADGVQGADGAPAPGLDQLDEMVTRVRTGGVGVRLRVTGTPRPLPPGVQLCVYRVVQEALTNVAKHAPGARTTVHVTHTATRTEVVVENGPPPSADRVRTRPGIGGLGLIGLGERVRLTGGSFRHGPRDGGYAVVARIPHHPSPPPPSPLALPASRDDALPQEHRRARRRAGRTLIAAAMVPLVTAALLSGVLMVWETRSAAQSVLDPRDYARLHVGQDRSEVRRFLPEQQTDYRPPTDEPMGEGTTCEYYAMTADRFDDRSGDAYRLCFREDTLVSLGTVAP